MSLSERGYPRSGCIKSSYAYGRIVSYNYDDKLQLRSIIGNGEETTYTYDDIGRLIKLTHDGITKAAYEYDAIGIVALAFIVMWLCFYYIIVNKRNMKAFYRYRIVRWLAIAVHIIDSILVIVFLWVSNAKTDIDYGCWQWLLLSNYILMVSVVVLDAFRVGYEKMRK